MNQSRGAYASIREIRGEWGRLGRVTIVHAERATGSATFYLADVPERQALDTAPWSVAGFIIEQRTASIEAASAFERIAIVAAAPAVTRLNVESPQAPAYSTEPQESLLVNPAATTYSATSPGLR